MIKYYNRDSNNDRWIVDLFNHRTGGYYLEAGALDGISDSCTYTLEKYFDWKGILVEPGIHFKDLKKNRPNSICENLCLSSRNGTVTFIHSRESGYSGIKKNLILMEEMHKQRWGKQKDEWRKAGYSETTKKSATLYDLLIKHRAPEVLDYLSLDIEGSEFDVLRVFPFEKIIVKAISTEGDSCNELLRSQGFRQVSNRFNQEAPWEQYFLHKDFYEML